jgi:hypothetical protein
MASSKSILGFLETAVIRYSFKIRPAGRAWSQLLVRPPRRDRASQPCGQMNNPRASGGYMVNSGVSCGEPKRTAPQNRPAPPSLPLSASLESVLNDPIWLGSAGFQMPDFESGARPFPPPQKPAILATTGR